ncbi:MAG TPA: DUF3556 domain-containing protein [Baekduia sp.]|nr:DUF3556 domain-containing protein [Baekduia sp.]
MGFITPAPPPFDVEDWKKKPHLERVKPLAQDWALNGFGTPYAIYLLYIVKLVIFSVAGLWVISLTEGLGGLGDMGDWWTEPIVWQKAVLWMILWELVGLGSSSMALSFRFLPPIGGVLYWLRPGTLRLPPWPDKVPFTRGSTRTVLDVALSLGVLGLATYLLFSSGTDVGTAGTPVEGATAGRLDTTLVAVLIGLLVALGLRDKVQYLSTRPEIYGLLLVVFLFPIENLIVASQFVLVGVWLGAATSKLNHHFSSVVAVMVSNTPWNRSRTIKRQLYRNHPEDLRPSTKAVLFAHLGTAIEYSLPIALLLTQGGTLGTIAVVGMLIFHIHITSTFPLAVPLEWNLFMIFGTLFLFGHYGDVPLNTFDDPLLGVILATSLVGVVALGNMRPDLISFLPSMRYYAGNWATSQWLFRKDTEAEIKFDTSIVKSSPVVANQLAKLYDPDTAEIFLTKALAFRAMHPHGRAINGLLPHAAQDGDVNAYTVREGEFLAGATIGWNFGDGHFHGKQLLDAVQERCGFEPGELRIITLESQPIHKQRQEYKIYDAATGLVEEGYVEVKDMIARQPWLDLTYEFPVHVTNRVSGAAGAEQPAPAVTA